MKDRQQVDHFKNDIKYVLERLEKETALLSKRYENQIFLLNARKLKKRLMNDYKTACLYYQELHMEQALMEVETNLHHYQKLCSFFSRCFSYQEICSIEWLRGIYECTLEYSWEEKPPKEWFDTENQVLIKEHMHFLYQQINQLYILKKQITDVWEPEVVEPQFLSFLRQFLQKKEANLRFLSPEYYKQRKKLVSLYLLPQNQFHDREALNLYNRLLKYHQYLTYLQEEGAFVTRDDYEKYIQKYDAFYSFLRLFPRKQQSYFYENYEEVLRYIKMLQGASNMPITQSLMIIFKEACSIQIQKISIDRLLSLVMQEKEALFALKNDITTFSRLQKNNKELLSLSNYRKDLYALDRIESKKAWLKKHEGKIRQIEKQKRLQTQCVFPTYQIADISSAKSIEQAISLILSKQQPILKQEVLKNIAANFKQKSMTKQLQQQLQSYLLHSELYEERDGFILSKKAAEIVFRCCKDDNSKRNVVQISIPEIEKGILSLLNTKYELTLDQISKEIGMQLGYRRRNKVFNDRIQTAVKNLKKDGKIYRFSGGFRLYEW